MYKKGNVFNRLKKLEDSIDLSDAQNISTIMIINDVGDNQYYYYDKEGKAIQITQQEYDSIIFGKNGRYKGKIPIEVKIVDNTHLESVLYEDAE